MCDCFCYYGNTKIPNCLFLSKLLICPQLSINCKNSLMSYVVIRCLTTIQMSLTLVSTLILVGFGATIICPQWMPDFMIAFYMKCYGQENCKVGDRKCPPITKWDPKHSLCICVQFLLHQKEKVGSILNVHLDDEHGSLVSWDLAIVASMAHTHDQNLVVWDKKPFLVEPPLFTTFNGVKP